MVARLTRILILLQITVAAILFALAIWVWRIDGLWHATILSVGAIFLFRLLITANSFFLAWRYRSETPAPCRLGWAGTLRLFKEEFQATLWSSSWGMPFRSFDKRTIKNSSAVPVLLIHGYGCNSGYWHSLSKLLTRAEISHHAVDLTPVLADIDAYVPAVQRAVEALCIETGHEQVIIVAHSMGGLAARAYLRSHGRRRIAKVITLGSPHHGTGLANSAPGLNSKQMRWVGSAVNGLPSDWLRQLESTENPELRALFVSIYSHHDNIVAPQTSSHLPGAKNIEFHGIGHVALALNPTVQACVLEEIHLAA